MKTFKWIKSETQNRGCRNAPKENSDLHNYGEKCLYHIYAFCCSSLVVVAHPADYYKSSLHQACPPTHIAPAQLFLKTEYHWAFILKVYWDWISHDLLLNNIDYITFFYSSTLWRWLQKICKTIFTNLVFFVFRNDWNAPKNCDCEGLERVVGKSTYLEFWPDWAFCRTLWHRGEVCLTFTSLQ